MPATKESMLKEFEEVIYRGQWNKKPSEALPAPKDAKYVQDLATIGAFLHPENSLFCEALEKLDTAMTKLFEERSKTTWTKSKIAPKSFSDFAHGRQGKDATKHLLSVVLAQHEKGEGFEGTESDTGKCVCFYNNLNGDEFGGAIRSMHLAKDYVGSDHGAYTHRIQWYCAGIVKTRLGLRSSSMATCFKSSGRVWGIVFDRNAKEGISLIKDDFRRPELMNPWIANNARYGNHSWPVLSAFLKSRIDRLPRGWTPDILRLNLGAKLFPDKVKPPLDYRKRDARENEETLKKCGLSEEELKLLDEAARGVAYDPGSKGLVSFAGGKKTTLGAT